MTLNVYRLEQRIEELMHTARVPGLALAVIRDLEVVYMRGFGVTSAGDAGLPVTPHTLFRIGSLTKSMTATVILRLVEAGRLDLDRPVGHIVPWLRFNRPGVEGQITLRQLLSHSAGLPTAHTPFGRREPDGLEAHIRQDLPGYEFLASPGKLYSYSNPGVRTAGLILQVAGGRPYTELMHDLLFEPLEMKRTTFDPLVGLTYPAAQSHFVEDDGTLRPWHRYGDDTGGYPSGAVMSTAADMTHYLLMHLAGGVYGGQRIVSAESLAQMVSPQVDRYAAGGGGYGLGLNVDGYKGRRRLWHEGSIGTFGSRMVLLPDDGAAVLLMCNRGPGFWERAAALLDAVLDELLGLPAPAPQPPVVEPDRRLWPLYEGSYLGDWRGLATVRVSGDELLLDWNGVVVPLSATRPDLYWGTRPRSSEVVSVGFVPENGSQVQYLQVNSSPCRRFVPEGPERAVPESWRAYAGKYVGVERVRVRLEGEQLFLYSEDAGKEMPLVPVAKSLFACDVGLVEFQPAADGAVPSLCYGRIYTLTRV